MKIYRANLSGKEKLFSIFYVIIESFFFLTYQTIIYLGKYS